MQTMPYNKDEFKTETWTTDPNNRYKIVDDLINRKLLDKKSKTEVINLLGLPSKYDDDFGFIEHIYRTDSLKKDTDLVYTIGVRPGIYQPRGHFLIFFKNDTVMNYRER